MADGDIGRFGRPVTVVSVQTGVLAPLGPKAVPSGIVKWPIRGPITVGPFGLDGDQQEPVLPRAEPARAQLHGVLLSLPHCLAPSGSCPYSRGYIVQSDRPGGSVPQQVWLGPVVQRGPLFLLGCRP